MTMIHNFLAIPLKVIFTLFVTVFIYRAVRLTRNYIAARSIGLPIVITPWSWQDPFWIIFGGYFSWLQYLPFGGWYKYSYAGWTLHDRFKTYTQLNCKAVLVVSPARNEVIIGDPDACVEVMAKYKKWRRPRALNSMFNTFGENVDSVEGEAWQRHRKIMGNGFKESNYRLVWAVARKQATQWIDSLSGKVEKEVTVAQLQAHCDTISGNVLMYAGFGQDYDFAKGGGKDIPIDHKRSFADVMQSMVRNLMLVWALRSINIPRFLEPRGVTDVRESKEELFQYFAETLGTRTGGLVEAMLDANDSEKKSGRRYLTQSELVGNMYMIQLAGFNTTSYAMLECIALLSLHRDVQEWVREKIGKLGGFEDTYADAVRCRAVLHESLRLYGAAPNLARHSSETQSIKIAGQYVIPAEMYVSSNFNGCHHDPSIWGKDTEVWRPQRWIEVIDGKEQLKEPRAFMPWSVGPRICPGKKFSQVEFTAVVCTLLKEYRLEGSDGLQDTIDDFEYVATPRMKKEKTRRVMIKFVKM